MENIYHALTVKINNVIPMLRYATTHIILLYSSLVIYFSILVIQEVFPFTVFVIQEVFLFSTMPCNLVKYGEKKIRSSVFYAQVPCAMDIQLNLCIRLLVGNRKRVNYKGSAFINKAKN